MHIVSDYQHITGHHCGSTAMGNLLRRRGVELSEAMVLGLGSGLGFVYLRGEGLNPTRAIMGRTWNLEENVASALGMQLNEQTTDNATEGWAQVKACLDEDMPVMVQCDLAELPYWKSNTPFNGHRIVVAGYDEQRGIALISDTHFEGLQEISLEALAKSRCSHAGPMGFARHASWTLHGEVQTRMEDAIIKALLDNVESMNVASDFAGIGVMEAFAEDVKNWRAQPDYEWCYRYAYQCIERRGTGGGNFRRLYRDYLMEASTWVPVISRAQLDIAMARTSSAWTTLAQQFELASRTPEPDETVLAHVESLSEAVFQFESMFWDRVPSVFQ